MKVLSLAFPGFTFIDLAGPLQAFSMLEGFESQIVWKATGEVASDAGVSVNASQTFETAWSDPDILFIPGNTKALFSLLSDDETLRFVADRGARAKWVTSACNGSLLLGAAGLLDGYKAASYWYTHDSLAQLGAIPTSERVVIDRNRVTGGGMTAGIDFGLTLLGLIDGEQKGKLGELLFEYAPEPPFACGRPELADEQTVAIARQILATLMPLEAIPTPGRRNRIG